MQHLLTATATAIVLASPMPSMAQNAEVQNAYDAAVSAWTSSEGAYSNRLNSASTTPVGQGLCVLYVFEKGPKTDNLEIDHFFILDQYAADIPRMGIALEMVPAIREDNMLAFPMTEADRLGNGCELDPDLYGPLPTQCETGVIEISAGSASRARELQSSFQALLQACSKY